MNGTRLFVRIDTILQNSYWINYLSFKSSQIFFLINIFFRATFFILFSFFIFSYYKWDFFIQQER